MEKESQTVEEMIQILKQADAYSIVTDEFGCPVVAYLEVPSMRIAIIKEPNE